MELNDFRGNFNECVVETRDPVRNHDFCCGCIQMHLSIPTSILGALGLIKLIISLIYKDILGKWNNHQFPVFALLLLDPQNNHSCSQ